MHLLNRITMLNTLAMVQRKVFIVHSSKMFFTYVLFLQIKIYSLRICLIAKVKFTNLSIIKFTKFQEI